MSKTVHIFQVLQTVYLSAVNKRPWLLTKMPFYAVAKGRTTGIFMTWADCEAQVKGFSGARYKKFDSVVSAQDFISSNSGSSGNVSYGSSAKGKPNNNINNSSNPNLKRTYSTSSTNYQRSDYHSHSNPSKSKTKHENDENDSSESEESDDGLATVLNKQMDDIEKRLKTFERGIDKIINKGSKSTGRSTVLIEPPQPKRQRKIAIANNEFEVDDQGYVQVYTDGACSANGQRGARAGIGVYWGEGHSHNVSQPVSGRATNNCGEIQAATHAIKQALQSGVKKLTINTDSQFLIKSVTKWMPGWKKKGWKLQSGSSVKNEIDFKELDSVKDKLDIKWNYVEAHRGIHGNEMADQLAKTGASLYNK